MTLTPLFGTQRLLDAALAPSTASLVSSTASSAGSAVSSASSTLPPSIASTPADEDDDDSATGNDDGESTTTSLKSGAIVHEHKHGRRFQMGPYPFPNDKQEQQRLDFLHDVYWRLMGEKLHLAPINQTGKVLDLGTGTGIWSIAMGDLYPGASIEGIDLANIQPRWMPANVDFVIDDIEKDWIDTAKRDFIFCRALDFSIKDWPRLTTQIYNALKPGGWFEFHQQAHEIYSEDKTLPPGNHIMMMLERLKEASEKKGCMMDPTSRIAEWATVAGFENIEERRHRLPVGSWPRDLC